MSKSDGSPTGTPPDGHDWGERTLQGYELRRGHRAPQKYYSDAREMRERYFEFSAFDPSQFDREKGQVKSWVYPDMMLHEWSPQLTTRAKGTTCIVRGKRGSGKTTLRDHMAIRLMEDDSERLDLPDSNDERVVVRGRKDSSDWRRFANWTTLYLPSDVDIDISWQEFVDRPAPEPEDIARDVVYYDGLMDLLTTLEERPSGTYNVVYPDPEHRGCNEIIEAESDVPYQIEYTPASEAGEDTKPTPTSHWWFAFLLARTARGTTRDSDGPLWMTVFLDEIGELAPENSPGGEDGHYTWELVKMLGSMMIDVRSAALSIVAFCHYWSDIASEWRKQFNYMISMPDERSNPVERRSSTHPKGWNSVPMTEDFISWKDVGTGLCYSEGRFTYFGWEDLDAKLREDDYIPAFKITLDGSADDSSTEFWYEEELLATFESPNGLELRVKDGAGIIDCTTPEIVEELETPNSPAFDDVSFAGLRDQKRSSVVVLDTPSGTREVAEIPHSLDGRSADPGGSINA